MITSTLSKYAPYIATTAVAAAIAFAARHCMRGNATTPRAKEAAGSTEFFIHTPEDYKPAPAVAASIDKTLKFITLTLNRYTSSDNPERTLNNAKKLLEGLEQAKVSDDTNFTPEHLKRIAALQKQTHLIENVSQPTDPTPPSSRQELTSSL